MFWKKKDDIMEYRPDTNQYDDNMRMCVKCGGKFDKTKMGSILIEDEHAVLQYGSVGSGRHIQLNQNYELYCIHCMPLYDKKVQSGGIFDYSSGKTTYSKERYYQFIEVNENGKPKNR